MGKPKNDEEKGASRIVIYGPASSNIHCIRPQALLKDQLFSRLSRKSPISIETMLEFLKIAELNKLSQKYAANFGPNSKHTLIKRLVRNVFDRSLDKTVVRKMVERLGSAYEGTANYKG
jgi:hypothetical protein